MNKKQLGWGITIISTVFALLIESLPIENVSPMLIIPLFILLLTILLGGLFSGHLLLIWHYHDFFKHWYGFASGLASYFFLFSIWIYFNNAAPTSPWLIKVHTAITVWLMVFVVTIGIVIFIFLTANDYGLRIMAVTMLGSMWGLFFLARQMTGEQLLEEILNVQIPIFSMMQCVTMWLLFAGVITFSRRMFLLIYKEASTTITITDTESTDE